VNRFNRTVVALQWKRDVINAVANLDLIEQTFRKFRVSRGLVEIPVDLLEEFDTGHTKILSRFVCSKNFHAKPPRRKENAEKIFAYSLSRSRDVFACAFVFGCARWVCSLSVLYYLPLIL
jgi:hypothetical protein